MEEASEQLTSQSPVERYERAKEFYVNTIVENVLFKDNIGKSISTKSLFMKLCCHNSQSFKTSKTLFMMLAHLLADYLFPSPRS